MNYRRVLVTGGAGFFGGHLVDNLVKEGFEVNVLDNLSTGKKKNISHHLKNENFHFVKGDIREKDAVEKASKGMEAIYHLAAVTSVPYSVGNPKITSEINVEGTRNLLDACLQASVERFIYVSSCAVYGEPEYLPINEKHPTKPLSPYAATKLEAEQICRMFQEKYGLKTTILRPFNVYGFGMRNDQYSGVITHFLKRLRNKKPPIIYADGLQTRDFICIDDVVRVLMMVLDCNHAVGRTFNIGTGKPTSINELAQLLIELFGLKGVRPEYQPARHGDIRHSYADISEVKDALGYEPKVSLKAGLSMLVDEVIGEK